MKKLSISAPISQRDPAWSKILLGFNTDPQYTIGNYGCLITTLAHYLTSIGYTETPNTINTKLKKVNGFVNGGYFVFESPTKIYPDVAVSFRSKRFYNSLTDADVNQMKKMIDAGFYLLTEVDFNPSQEGEQMHWVGVFGYDNDGHFMTMDPWTGTITDLGVYGDIKKSIYSYTCYGRVLPFESSQNGTDCEEIKKELLDTTELLKSTEELNRGLIDKVKVLEDSSTAMQTRINGLNEAVSISGKRIVELLSIIADMKLSKFSVSQSLGFLLDAIKNGRFKEVK